MSSSEKVYFTGSCACGLITYTSTSLPRHACICHCITCQKLSGSAYQAFAHIPTSSLTFTNTSTTPPKIYTGFPPPESGVKVLRLSPLGERLVCKECCSSLGMRYQHQKDVIGMTLGSVDVGSFMGDEEVREGLRPEMHIFGEQMAWWVRGMVEASGVEVFERFPGRFEEGMMEAEKGGKGGRAWFAGSG